MASEEHENEINYITSNDDDLQSLFEEMYLELEIFYLKNAFPKKKKLSLEKDLNELKENFENLEKTKTTFRKENNELK